MPKDKTSSTSIWDDFSEKIESLREALNASADETDSSDKPSEESDAFYHFTANDSVPLDSIDIESLRKALNTPIDEIISSHKYTEESTLETQNDREDTEELGSSDNKHIEVDEVTQSHIPETPAEIVEENDTADDKDLDDIAVPENQIQEIDEPDEFDVKQDIQDLIEETDTKHETASDDFFDPNPQIQETDESHKFDDEQESQDMEKVADGKNETSPDDLVELNLHMQKTDESDEFDDGHESQDIETVADGKNETSPDDLVEPNPQIQETDETGKLNDEQERHDVEIKIKTEKTIKNEKIDNYWKQGETPNPYILKVDESRERLNKSLEMARELVNRQSEEPPKQEKKRFQFSFTRGDKNGNHKSTTAKEKGKPSKKSNQLKPMVYEMLESKQEDQTRHTDQPDQAYKDSQDSQLDQAYKDSQDSQPVQGNQTNQVKPDKERKKKTKQSNDHVKNEQEKEILNHRNRLEKSRSLGVPVFVKKPVNLEQIRQLKSMVTSQNDVKILVDTGSSQGRLLVISGQDPDTLLNTLNQLPIVKSTAVEDETINITL